MHTCNTPTYMYTQEFHNGFSVTTRREPADPSARCQLSLSAGATTAPPFLVFMRANAAARFPTRTATWPLRNTPHPVLTVACFKNSVCPRFTRDETERPAKRSVEKSTPGQSSTLPWMHMAEPVHRILFNTSRPDARTLLHSFGRRPSDVKDGSRHQPLD